MSPLDQFSGSGIRPGLPGRNFRLEGDPEIYNVLGLKGRSNKVMLQAASDETTLSLSEDEFLRCAIRIED